MVKLSSLDELKQYVKVISSRSPDKDPDSTIKTAIYLLNELPAARESLLEYFASIFHLSLKNFVQNSKHGGPIADQRVEDIKLALEDLVHKGPKWTSLLTEWGITLLGSLMEANGRIFGQSIQNAQNIWMNCPGVKCLFSLIKTCFSKLNPIETNQAIDLLVATVIKSRPYLDWVVVQLGSCFPRLLITKIIGYRLDDSVLKPSFDFEIPIFAELYQANEHSFVAALKETIVEQFLRGRNTKTIPYLVHLLKNSQILLQPIARAFLELFDEQQINAAACQGLIDDAVSLNLLDLLPAMIMRINENGTKILLILAQYSDIPFCAELLQQVLRELECQMLDDSQLTGEFPLLIDLLRDDTKPKLWKACLSSRAKEQETAIRLILLISPRTPILYHHTIAELLKYSNLGNGSLVRILGGVSGMGAADQLDFRRGFELSLEAISLANKRMTGSVDPNASKGDANPELIQLQNIVQLIELEKVGENPHLKRQLVIQCLSRHSVSVLLRILDGCFKRVHLEVTSIEKPAELGIKRLKCEPGDVPREDKKLLRQQIHLIIAIIERILPEIQLNLLSISDLLRFAQLTVRTFFWTLTEPDRQQKSITMSRIMSLLKRVCASRKGIKVAALRDLLEGALVVYRPLFGGPPFDEETPAGPILESMMRLNQQQDVISGTNRSYLHAGLIGQGVRTPGARPNQLCPEVQQLYLDAVSACCDDPERTALTDGFSTASLLLVEFISPDVMYNGLPWPDEEFQKVTIERDLQIRRTFKHSPILWSLLSLFAVHRPALCFASVLLRALCATVMHQWRARSVEKPFTGQIKHPNLVTVTEKLLEVMALGQLLPPPLNHLHHVIGHLDPVEVPTVLRDCVWNYMKDNVPSPVIFEVLPRSGQVWRNPVTSRPPAQYTDTLRWIMLKKLTTLGSVYHQMFVLPEEPTPVAGRAPTAAVAATGKSIEGKVKRGAP